VSEALATNVATVLFDLLLDELTSLDVAKLLDVAVLVAFELLEDSPHEEDLFAEEVSAACWPQDDDLLVAKLSVTAPADCWPVAKLSVNVADDCCPAARLSVRDAEDILLVAKLSDCDAFAARLALEDLLAAALSAALSVAVLPPELDLLLVALPAIAPPAAVVVLLVPPLPAAVLGGVEEVLVKFVVPPLEAVPFLPAAAKFAVSFDVEAWLLLAAKSFVAPRDAVDVFVAVAFRAPLAASLFVVPLDLLAVAESPFVKLLDSLLLAESAFVVPLDSLALAANALVVLLDLLAPLDSEADWVNVADLLAPACCILSSVLL
jgi:hypothetical protein